MSHDRTDSHRPAASLGAIEYERLRPADCGKLAALLDAPTPEDHFRRVDGPTYYEWLNFQGSCGPAITWVAWQRDTLVASLSIVRRKMALRGRPVVVGKLEDLRSAASVRGTGVVSGVFQRAFGDAQGAGIEWLMAGPTSPMSYPIFTGRLGFVEPFAIRTWLRVLSLPKAHHRHVGWVSARFGHAVAAWTKRTQERRLQWDFADDGYPDRWGGWWQHPPEEIALTTIRDPAYLAWRYRDSAEDYAAIELGDSDGIVGGLILKVTRQRGLRILNVVDLIFDRQCRRAVESLLGASVEFALSRRCHLVAIWGTWSPIRSALTRCGFVPGPSSTHLLVRPTLDSAPADPIRQLKRVDSFLTMGDYHDI